MAHYQREYTRFSNSLNVLNVSRDFYLREFPLIARRVSAFGVWLGNGHSGSSTNLRSRTNCMSIAFTTVVRGIPIVSLTRSLRVIAKLFRCFYCQCRIHTKILLLVRFIVNKDSPHFPHSYSPRSFEGWFQQGTLGAYNALYGHHLTKKYFFAGAAASLRR